MFVELRGDSGVQPERSNELTASVLVSLEEISGFTTAFTASGDSGASVIVILITIPDFNSSTAVLASIPDFSAGSGTAI